MTPEAKATRERIVRLLHLLGQQKPRVVTHQSGSVWSADCFSKIDGRQCVLSSAWGTTEAAALAAIEREVRSAVRIVAKHHREAADASLNSIKQQLIEVAAQLAKADALESAMKEQKT